MYFYIFDPRTAAEIKAFDRVQGRLLNLLAEHHIEGETYRVTAIRTVELLVEQALNAEAKTVIVVGSDGSLNKAINALVRKRGEMTMGYIPLDGASTLANIFGMPANIEEAVRVLAGRLTTELDLGKVGEHYFLSKVDLGPTPFSRLEGGFWGLGALSGLMKFEPFTVTMSLENSYTATSEVLAAQIINSRSNDGAKIKLGDPTDRRLDILMLHKLSNSQLFRYRKALASGFLDSVPGATIMHAKKIEILGPKKLPLSIEGQVYTKAPATISVAEEKVKIIIGKTRQF